MTIFHIYVLEDDGKIWKVCEPGDIHFADLDRCVEILVGLPDEFIDNPVPVIEDGSSQRYYGNTHHQQEIKKNLPEPDQK
jgi:hypothetical protein